MTPAEMAAIRDAAHRLASLLDDPEPGLATWCLALGYAIADVRSAIGPLPVAEAEIVGRVEPGEPAVPATEA